MQLDTYEPKHAAKANASIAVVGGLLAMSLSLYAPGIPAQGQGQGPPVQDVRVIEGQIDVTALPPVALAPGAAVKVNNTQAEPVPVSLVADDATHPAVLLPPGGRTIGGPGRFHAGPNEDAFIIGGFTNTNRQLMCYTFFNLGDAPFSIFGNGHPAGNFQDIMFPGEQETHCGLVSGVRIECGDNGQPCMGVYRVDIVD